MVSATLPVVLLMAPHTTNSPGPLPLESGAPSYAFTMLIAGVPLPPTVLDLIVAGRVPAAPVKTIMPPADSGTLTPSMIK